MIDEFLGAIGANDIADIGEMVCQSVGNHLIVITNMQGLLLLTDTEIQVKADKRQKAIVRGEFLEVSTLNKNDITISGRILSVSFEGI